MTSVSPAERSASPRRNDSKERICQVAAKLFASQGFHATTMDDVAAAVRLNKATIYYYFASKTDLLYEIYDRATELALDGIRGVNDDTAADIALATLIRYHIGTITKQRDLSSVYFQEIKWLPQWLSRSQLAAIRAKEDQYSKVLTALIERGISEGTLKAEDPRIAAFAIVGMLGWSHAWFRARGRLTSDEVADRLIDFMFDGLSGDRSTIGKTAHRPRARRTSR
jgi:AcrR family transcriptional regulator